jgi:hypothetical protein
MCPAAIEKAATARIPVSEGIPSAPFLVAPESSDALLIEPTDRMMRGSECAQIAAPLTVANGRRVVKPRRDHVSFVSAACI